MEQAGHARVGGGEAAPAGPLDEGATQEALPDARGSGDDQIMPFGDPATGAQRQDLGPVQIAAVFEVDVFQRGRIAELGRA